MSDTDMDNMLEADEYIRMLKVFGHNSDSGDMASFNIAFNNAESVPLTVAIEAWIQFRTDETTSATNDTMDEAIKTALREEL